MWLRKKLEKLVTGALEKLNQNKGMNLFQVGLYTLSVI